MNNLIFEDDLDREDFFPDMDEEVVTQQKIIIQRQDIFRFTAVFRQHHYESILGPMKQNVLSFIESLPDTSYMNAETLIAGVIFMLRYKTLTKENFDAYLTEMLDKKVDKYDLLKYIRSIS